jgi:DNA repair exonuclease SbcCD nuclease subunit
VYGLSYGQAEVTENLARRFRREAGPGLHVGLLHCTVGATADHAPYAPCTVEDLHHAGMDYWALGHIHRRSIVREGDPWIVYPGNLQGRSPKPSEQGPKGAVLVEVRGGRVHAVNPLELDRVRFVTAEVDAGRAGDLVELENALLEQAERLRGEHEGRGLIVRAYLCGRGGVWRDLRRTGTVAEILEDLREAAKGVHPPLWWESLRDETRGGIDREAIRRRGDFSAELLSLAAERAADREQLGAFAKSWLKALPRTRLKHWLSDRSPEELLSELEQAQELALTLLEAEADQ